MFIRRTCLRVITKEQDAGCVRDILDKLSTKHGTLIDPPLHQKRVQNTG